MLEEAASTSSARSQANSVFFKGGFYSNSAYEFSQAKSMITEFSDR
jgi:hypothetical protein